ncbi:MAG: hypothetical protein GY906_24495 [bacterium]|nr:hypothetical protein [bacterium]
MSSRRRIRRNACTGKVCYKTVELAEEAITVMKKKHRGRFLTKYRCAFGHHYHIGRSGSRKRW